MELRPIPAADWADWYENELCTTFPDCECKPLADIPNSPFVYMYIHCILDSCYLCYYFFHKPKTM